MYNLSTTQKAAQIMKTTLGSILFALAIVFVHFLAWALDHICTYPYNHPSSRNPYLAIARGLHRATQHAMICPRCSEQHHRNMDKVLCFKCWKEITEKENNEKETN